MFGFLETYFCHRYWARCTTSLVGTGYWSRWRAGWLWYPECGACCMSGLRVRSEVQRAKAWCVLYFLLFVARKIEEFVV